METRRPLIAANWKMFKTLPEALDTAGSLAKSLVESTAAAEVMIAPSHAFLHPVYQVIKNSPIALGAQNLHWEPEGAYTGEVSAKMLRSVNCTYVIIGHSERRQFFSETNYTVNRKIQAAIEAGLRPVLCVGETAKQRDSKETFSVLDKQVQSGLKGLFRDQLENLVLAYEPVWAIGTGKTANSGQAQEVHEFLRSTLDKMFSLGLAKSVRILYGGSVKPENIAELMQMPDIDGALVGGASLEAETFKRIVNY